MKTYKATSVDTLISLPERTLQSKVVEPLLRSMGFTHVVDNSGPNEHGKDLLAIKDEFGRAKLYAIQIKKLQITGRYRMSNSLRSVLHQLEQLFSEEVGDPVTNHRRKPDRCVFITPYPIKKSALESAISMVRELERREITIIDGPQLVDLILKHIPESLETIDAEQQYRIRLANLANRIAESKAFGVGREVKLEDIYVELGLGQHGIRLSKISSRSQASLPSKVFAAHPDDVQKLLAVFERWAKTSSFYRSPPPFSRRALADSAKKQLEKKKKQVQDSMKQEQAQGKEGSQTKLEKLSARLERLKEHEVVDVDPRPVLRPAKSEIKSYLRDSARINQSDSPSFVTQVIRRGIKLRNDVVDLQSVSLVQEQWPRTFCTEGDDDSDTGVERLSAGTLLRVNHAVFLRGAPGSGKTTLVRKLAGEVARAGGEELPILLYLIKARRFSSVDQLFAALKEELQRLGLSVSSKGLATMMKNAKCRVFLDGLDELGEFGHASLEAIKELCSSYPDCPVIVTARDTFAFKPWKNALNIQTKPFSDQQLRLFIRNWFQAEPTWRAGLSTWLANNQAMRKAARTPIVAALLCALYHVGADLPSTETELFEQRFQLLLGRWEQAKGIQSLPVQARKRYELFLMRLAYQLHKDQVRSAAYSKAVQLAKEYSLNRIHNNAEAMVQECIHRGLLEWEVSGGITFGHLTYQEFLAGKCLYHENPLDFIWKNLGNDWWLHALEFYASLKGDISTLLEARTTRSVKSLKAQRIRHLLSLAPLTSPSVIQRLGLSS